jgi:hypothetical protein
MRRAGARRNRRQECRRYKRKAEERSAIAGAKGVAIFVFAGGEAALYLATAPFVTGQILAVDGGRMLV